MTREQIIRMAREAGFEFPADYDLTEPTSRLEHFAALVAAAEREACAKLVFQTQESDDEYVSLQETIALAINARGLVLGGQE